ncbi:hypothetical protein SCUCBS95973_006662 [Sporothrix curviconia]|uniref:Uncharacterized protein n=1 Tax=Sporothrix curviconia TaxID=1260050 RepID=A0ABP0C9H4_9PEZI
MAVRQRLRKAFSSKDEFKKLVQTKEQGTYFNEDLLPSPPAHRSWTALHFFAYYLTQTFSPSSYNLGASLVSLGLQCYWGAAARAGTAFASLGMMLAVVATNIGSNSLPVGADISGLLPR